MGIQHKIIMALDIESHKMTTYITVWFIFFGLFNNNYYNYNRILYAVCNHPMNIIIYDNYWSTCTKW